MIGDGPERVDAENEARELQVSADVRFLGRLDSVASLLQESDLFLLPSQTESFGLAALEAMACGAPVVTTRGTAMEEVADGAAVLVDARDPAEIAAGIERATAERDSLVARGLERSRAFRWDAVAAATVEVYREAAE
jgi:glycosyltransferase involved in cell wall biosynthesis